MMDALIKEKLELLSSKINALLAEKVALKDEIRYYQAENRELKSELNKERGVVKNFPLPTEKPNIAIENGSYAEKVAAITKQIDVYVEEIDKCIAHLGE
jgi:regulator of replication initiation timing